MPNASVRKSWRLAAQFHKASKVLRPGNVWQYWISFKKTLKGPLKTIACSCKNEVFLVTETSRCWRCQVQETPSEESYNLEVELACETGYKGYSDETQGMRIHKTAGAHMMILKSSDAERRASRLDSWAPVLL